MRAIVDILFLEGNCARKCEKPSLSETAVYTDSAIPIADQLTQAFVVPEGIW